jgi:tetratricopeptide (TPR) repeat protein
VARAAVKAKQQAKAKAQPAKARARGRRRHSGGGNPNQQLFFVRLRRGQKWLYALLAVVFAVTFAGVGVGSGGGGLQDLWTGIFGGGGGSSVSKAQGEIKDDPAKGYRDLATAYESKGQNVQAIGALQSYLALKKKDANGWAELGGLQESQAQKYTTQYQSVQQAAQLADPSAPFQPSGVLAQMAGTNAAYQSAAQRASARTSQLFQQATTALQSAVTSYDHATKIHPNDATLQEQLATAAVNAGNTTVAINALQTYLKLYPNSPLKSQVNAEIKQLRRAQTHPSSAYGQQSQSGHK